MARGLALALSLLAGCKPAPVAEDPPVAAVPELGLPDERAFTAIATAADDLDVPRDLAFHPDRRHELWIVNRASDSVTIVFDPGTDAQRFENRQDVMGYHFMEEVSSLSFGANDTFATCQESENTYDDMQMGDDFMGPALWSADLDIFAEVNQHNRLLGSHLDMLHESPLCMGIAHDVDNVYWVFDGFHGNIVRYDFQDDHGPGYDDHSDGIVRRYVDAEVTREPDIPGHLVLDHDTGWLYIADTGTGRVLRLDTNSGEPGRSLPQDMEPLQEYREYDGATVEVVAEGLKSPSGIALHDGRLFVADNLTNELVAYQVEDGSELDRIDVEAVGIMGIDVGPEGKLYYADGEGDAVYRLDPIGD
jgi:sugar lactone lactonase YvrE